MVHEREKEEKKKEREKEEREGRVKRERRDINLLASKSCKGEEGRIKMVYVRPSSDPIPFLCTNNYARSLQINSGA